MNESYKVTSKSDFCGEAGLTMFGLIMNHALVLVVHLFGVVIYICFCNSFIIEVLATKKYVGKGGMYRCCCFICHLEKTRLVDHSCGTVSFKPKGKRRQPFSVQLKNYYIHFLISPCILLSAQTFLLCSEKSVVYLPA